MTHGRTLFLAENRAHRFNGIPRNTKNRRMSCAEAAATEVTGAEEDAPVVQLTDAERTAEEPTQPKPEAENAFTGPTTPSSVSDNPPSSKNDTDAGAATVEEKADDVQAAGQPVSVPEAVVPAVNEPVAENVVQSSQGSDVSSPGDKLGKTEPLNNIAQVNSMASGDSCAVEKSDDEDAEARSKAKGARSTEVNGNDGQSDASPAVSRARTDGEELLIEKLKQALKKTMEERDSYRDKLDSAGRKLTILQESYDAIAKGDEDTLRRTVDQLRGKLIQASLQLEDRNRLVANQEKQISALNSQVASLKEVESLTRSLLQIRNMEVKYLQVEVNDMEVRISEERERYNTMINKMDAAVRLNSDLKKEYETQLCLFRDLREKYEEKVTLLSEEKRALENAVQSK